MSQFQRVHFLPFSSFHWEKEPKVKRGINAYWASSVYRHCERWLKIFGDFLTIAVILWSEHYHPRGWWGNWDSRVSEKWHKLPTFAQWEVGNGFSTLFLKSPFKLAASPALCPRETVRGRTCVEEKKTYFTHEEISGKKDWIYSFTSVSGMKCQFLIIWVSLTRD